MSRIQKSDSSDFAKGNVVENRPLSEEAFEKMEVERRMAADLEDLLDGTALENKRGTDSIHNLGNDAVEPLIRFIKSPVAYRIPAACLIGDFGIPARKIIPDLVESMRENPNRPQLYYNWDFRFCAEKSLEAIADEETASILFPIMRSGYDSTEERHTTFPVIEHLLISMGQRSLPEMVARLKNGDKTDQWLALRILARIGPEAKEAIPLLIDTMNNNRDKWMQIEAIVALGYIGPAAVAAVPDLFKLFKKETESYNVLSPSKSALIRIGSAAVPGFIDALKDENPEIRLQAADALGQIGPAACWAIPELEKMALHDPSLWCRDKAEEALGRLKESIR